MSPASENELVLSRIRAAVAATARHGVDSGEGFAIKVVRRRLLSSRAIRRERDDEKEGEKELHGGLTGKERLSLWNLVSSFSR